MSKAASALSVSHPVVSRSIADLERTLSTKLLIRHPRGVELTPSGQALLQRSLAAFDELRMAVQEVGVLTDPSVGEVHVGTTSGLGATFMAAVIEKLTVRYPRIAVRITTGDSRKLQSDVETRAIDVLITRIFRSLPPSLNMEPLCEDAYVIAAGVENSLATRRKLSLADTLPHRWVLPPADNPAGRFIIEAFQATGLEVPHIAVTAFPVEIRISLIETGKFLTILPRSILRFPQKRPLIKELPITLPNASGPIAAVTLRGRNLVPPVQHFIQIAREVAGARATVSPSHAAGNTDRKPAAISRRR